MKRLFLPVLFLLVLTGKGAELPPVKAVLFPFREATLAARAESELEPYRFRLGEAFPAGSVLVTLDDSRYLIDVERMTEQLNFARATYEDKKQLREKNFTSDYELKKAEFDYRMAESSLADAKLNLSFCTVSAPFAGKIVEILTREHETVRTGQPLCRIIDDNQLLAVMNVPMNDENLTVVGKRVSIKIPGVEGSVTGEIHEVTPQADHRTGTIRIRVLIDNRDGRLKAGMTGELVNGQ